MSIRFVIVVFLCLVAASSVSGVDARLDLLRMEELRSPRLRFQENESERDGRYSHRRLSDLSRTINEAEDFGDIRTMEEEEQWGNTRQTQQAISPEFNNYFDVKRAIHELFTDSFGDSSFSYSSFSYSMSLPEAPIPSGPMLGISWSSVTSGLGSTTSDRGAYVVADAKGENFTLSSLGVNSMSGASIIAVCVGAAVALVAAALVRKGLKRKHGGRSASSPSPSSGSSSQISSQMYMVGHPLNNRAHGDFEIA